MIYSGNLHGAAIKSRGRRLHLHITGHHLQCHLSEEQRGHTQAAPSHTTAVMRRKHVICHTEVPGGAHSPLLSKPTCPLPMLPLAALSVGGYMLPTLFHRSPAQ